ncbi:hypothetical protein OPIT5_08135 [Opitutaceae bacterium TAV5]|nr:hypothetical protein OPIT5_08135 [Opitutaceae bacterium TAV5]
MFQARLEDRQNHARKQAEADARWLQERGGINPAERLERWDAWLADILAQTLRWPEDETRRVRLMGKCSMEITSLVRKLRGRGWLLDGAALAEHVRACLAPIAAAQAAGKVRDLYPYLARSVGDYVGQHAEEIQAHARRTGADEAAQSVGMILAGLVGDRLKPRPPSLTELIVARAGEVKEARTLREAQAARRRAAKAQESANAPFLLGL